MRLVTPTMAKVGVKYGAISSVLFTLVFAGVYLLEMNTYIEVRVFDFLLIPIFVFFALYEFRSLNKGYLEYAQGMTLGLMTVLFLAVVSSFIILLFHFSIDEGQLGEYIEMSLQALEENKEKVTEKMDFESYESAKKDLEKAGIGSVALDNLFKKNIIGLLLTVMISIILRKSSNKKNGK